MSGCVAEYLGESNGGDFCGKSLTMADCVLKVE